MRGQGTETVRRGCSNVGKIGKKPVGAPEERRPPILIPLDERRVAAHRQPMAVNPVRQMPPAATHHGLIEALQPFQGGRVLDKSACGGFVERIETGYFRRGDVPRLQQRDPSVTRERRIGCASEVGGRSIALLPAPQPAYHEQGRSHPFRSPNLWRYFGRDYAALMSGLWVRFRA